MSRATMTPQAPQAMPNKQAQTGQPTYDQIAKRAYEKWLKRGRPQGTQMQDWFEAEQELKKEMSMPGGYRS